MTAGEGERRGRAEFHGVCHRPAEGRKDAQLLWLHALVRMRIVARIRIGHVDFFPRLAEPRRDSGYLQQREAGAFTGHHPPAGFAQQT